MKRVIALMLVLILSAMVGVGYAQGNMAGAAVMAADAATIAADAAAMAASAADMAANAMEGTADSATIAVNAAAMAANAAAIAANAAAMAVNATEETEDTMAPSEVAETAKADETEQQAETVESAGVENTEMDFQAKVDAMERPTETSDFTLFLHRYQLMSRYILGKEMYDDPNIKISLLGQLTIGSFADEFGWDVSTGDPWSGKITFVYIILPKDAPETYKLEAMTLLYSILHSEERDTEVYAAWSERNLDHDFSTIIDAVRNKKSIVWGEGIIYGDIADYGLSIVFGQ